VIASFLAMTLWGFMELKLLSEMDTLALIVAEILFLAFSARKRLKRIAGNSS